MRSGNSPSGGSRFRPARWLGVLGATAVLVVGAIAASAPASGAPAAASGATQTGTIWIPLICNLGVVTVDVGAAFTATLPTSVTPGEEFNLENAFATIDIPAQSANSSAFAFGNPSQVEGVVTTFDTNLSNAIAPTLINADTSRVSGGGAWAEPSTDGGVSADPNVGTPKGSPAVINLVAAAQPNNTDAPSPLDPLINGPSPLAGFTAYPEPPLMGVFSWGPAPVDGSGMDGTPGGNPTTNAYAPAPGTGGGTSPSDGTPDAASGGPIQVTGAVGQDVKLGIGAPGDLIKIGKTSYTFAVNNDIFFNETTSSPPGWSGDTPVECGIDTSGNAVPSPDPSYFPVATGISIPIVSSTTTTTTTPTTTTTTTSKTTTTTPTTTTTKTTPTTTTTTKTTTTTTTSKTTPTTTTTSKTTTTRTTPTTTTTTKTTTPTTTTTSKTTTTRTTPTTTTTTKTTTPTTTTTSKTTTTRTTPTTTTTTKTTTPTTTTTSKTTTTRTTPTTTTTTKTTTTTTKTTTTTTTSQGAPSVFDVFPHRGRPFSLVVIVGQDLANATAVDFGSQPAIFMQLGDNVIVALAPPEPSGTRVDVTVVTPGGTSATSHADRFRYRRGSGRRFGFVMATGLGF